MDGIVCDPFLGGGTTAVAAIKLKRRWIGFEINEDTARLVAAATLKVAGDAINAANARKDVAVAETMSTPKEQA